MLGLIEHVGRRPRDARDPVLAPARGGRTGQQLGRDPRRRAGRGRGGIAELRQTTPELLLELDPVEEQPDRRRLVSALKGSRPVGCGRRAQAGRRRPWSSRRSTTRFETPWPTADTRSGGSSAARPASRTSTWPAPAPGKRPNEPPPNRRGRRRRRGPDPRARVPALPGGAARGRPLGVGAGPPHDRKDHGPEAPRPLQGAAVCLGAIAYLPAIAFIGIVAVVPTGAFGSRTSSPDRAVTTVSSLRRSSCSPRWPRPRPSAPTSARDFLGIYLASPLNRTTYLLAKAIAVVGVLLLVTLGPPLLLLIGLALQNAGPRTSPTFMETLGRDLRSPGCRCP